MRESLERKLACFLDFHLCSTLGVDGISLCSEDSIFGHSHFLLKRLYLRQLVDLNIGRINLSRLDLRLGFHRFLVVLNVVVLARHATSPASEFSQYGVDGALNYVFKAKTLNFWGYLHFESKDNAIRDRDRRKIAQKTGAAGLLGRG